MHRFQRSFELLPSQRKIELNIEKVQQKKPITHYTHTHEPILNQYLPLIISYMKTRNRMRISIS